MKTCAIIANGYFHPDAMVDQISSIQKAFGNKGVRCDVIYTDTFVGYIKENSSYSTLKDYAFLVFLDKDVYLSHILEKSGYKLVNGAKAIELCDDKMKTYVELSDRKVPIPDTISSPLNYVGKADDFYVEIENRLGYPVVIKEVYGSMGKGVYLAKNRDELIKMRNDLILKPHLYQKFIGEGGKDIRVIVIGGKAVGAMERRNENDFRSNVELGGKGVAVTLDEKVKDIAEKSAKILGLDYCGVDVLKDGDNYYVCEVNSNAFFKGFRSATNIDVARLYVDYLCKKFFNA